MFQSVENVGLLFYLGPQGVHRAMELLVLTLEHLERVVPVFYMSPFSLQRYNLGKGNTSGATKWEVGGQQPNLIIKARVLPLEL